MVLVLVGSLWYSRRLTERGKRNLGVLLALITALIMLPGILLRLSDGTFDLGEDLPIYPCRWAAWVLIFAVFHRSKYWIGVLYFWIMAVTVQSLITPALEEGYPHYMYIRYWVLHAGLVVTVIYAVLIYRLRLTWRNFFHSILVSQIYLVLMHLSNILLDGNYGYTMERPPGTSVLDIFGPLEWPWYVLAGDLLMIALFVPFMLPFLLIRKTNPLFLKLIGRQGG